jgi:hypothetical protein
VPVVLEPVQGQPELVLAEPASEAPGLAWEPVQDLLVAPASVVLAQGRPAEQEEQRALEVPVDHRPSLVDLNWPDERTHRRTGALALRPDSPYPVARAIPDRPSRRRHSPLPGERRLRQPAKACEILRATPAQVPGAASVRASESKFVWEPDGEHHRNGAVVQGLEEEEPALIRNGVEEVQPECEKASERRSFVHTSDRAETYRPDRRSG